MDAQLNDLIRLKQPPSAPIERWQMLPMRQKVSRPQEAATPACFSSPLRTRTSNLANIAAAKTPESTKFVVKYKKTPKLGKTPGKTPSHATKTPGNSSKTPHSKRRTPPKPGRTGHTPAGCRFIPSRSTTDMDYSHFLLTKRDSSSREEEDSPTKEEYRQALMKALSKSQNQKGVLSFSTATPSIGESM